MGFYGILWVFSQTVLGHTTSVLIDPSLRPKGAEDTGPIKAQVGGLPVREGT